MPQDPSGGNRTLPGSPDEVFARRLRVLRERAGLAQRQVADAMTGLGYRMRQTTIAKIEAGQRPVYVGEAVAFGHIFGVGVAGLVTEPDDPPARDLASALAHRAGCEQRVRELAGQADQARAVLSHAEVQLVHARMALDSANQDIESIKRSQGARVPAADPGTDEHGRAYSYRGRDPYTDPPADPYETVDEEAGHAASGQGSGK